MSDMGEKMKRALLILLDLLSIGLLIGGYVIQYFAGRKLGMVRWLNYHERKVQEAVPVDVLKYVLAIAVVLLTVILVGRFVKRRGSLCRLDAVRMGILVILSAVYLGLTLFVTADVTPAYFLILPMVGGALFLQIIRNLF